MGQVRDFPFPVVLYIFLSPPFASCFFFHSLSHRHHSLIFLPRLRFSILIYYALLCSPLSLTLCSSFLFHFYFNISYLVARRQQPFVLIPDSALLSFSLSNFSIRWNFLYKMSKLFWRFPMNFHILSLNYLLFIQHFSRDRNQ